MQLSICLEGQRGLPCWAVFFNLMALNIMLGQLVVDEAIGLAKSICAATPASILLVLLPVLHLSTEQEIIVKHRRHLEDILMASAGVIANFCGQSFLVVQFFEWCFLLCGLRSFDTTDVAVTYSDTAHGGDRCCRNQPCPSIELVPSACALVISGWCYCNRWTIATFFHNRAEASSHRRGFIKRGGFHPARLCWGASGPSLGRGSVISSTTILISVRFPLHKGFFGLILR